VREKHLERQSEKDQGRAGRASNTAIMREKVHTGKLEKKRRKLLGQKKGKHRVVVVPI